MVVAVLDGAIDRVRALLAGKADANGSGYVVSAKASHTPLTALLCDAKLENKTARDTAVMLIEAGARPDMADDSKNTPLHCDCSVEVLTVLLKAIPAPNVNVAGESGLTPVHCCASRDRPEPCQALITAKADVDAFLPLLGTPLMVAVQNGRAAVVSVLLSNRADVTVSRDNMSALNTPPKLAASPAAVLACKELVCRHIEARALPAADFVFLNAALAMCHDAAKAGFTRAIHTVAILLHAGATPPTHGSDLLLALMHGQELKSDASVVVNRWFERTRINAKYSQQHYLNFADRHIDGFVDPGRGQAVPERHAVLRLLRNVDSSALPQRECLLVDANVDAGLAVFVQI